MTWNKWPYWLKGGVIGGGIAFISTLFFISTPIPCVGWTALLCNSWSFWSLPFILLVPLHPLFTHLIKNYPQSSTLLISASVVITWFLIGSVIGAIIDCCKTTLCRSGYGNTPR